MIRELMYVERKSGYCDNGPAWIGYVMTSKTRNTIYFNDHAFQKQHGGNANYYDVESGEDYWISGVKKRESNRHPVGRGKIMIDRRAIPEFLHWIGEGSLPKGLYDVVDIEDSFPIQRISQLLNAPREN